MHSTLLEISLSDGYRISLERRDCIKPCIMGIKSSACPSAPAPPNALASSSSPSCQRTQPWTKAVQSEQKCLVYSQHFLASYSIKQSSVQVHSVTFLIFQIKVYYSWQLLVLFFHQPFPSNFSSESYTMRHILSQLCFLILN